jgi:hypothetical protein
MYRLLFLLVGLCAGCGGLLPEKLPASDPRVAELLAVVAASNHTALGFTAIDTNADFRLENSGRGGAYDRMLHIYGKTSRTLAFKRAGDGWRWTHEQEIFEGPRDYTSVDGTFKESLCLTFETERLAAACTHQLTITYSGDDAALAWPRELALADALAALAAWGHDVSRAPTNTAQVVAAITDPVEKRNRIRIASDPFRVVLEVESPSGIGRARLTPATPGRWPERVVVRLRLAALEAFTVESPAANIHTAFQSYSPFEQWCTLSGPAEQRIGPASPYWLFARRQRAENLIELTLPAALFKDNPATLDFQWIDYFR